MPVSASGACPACGGQLHAWRAVHPADPALGHEPVPLSRCQTCGSAVTGGPIPPGLYDRGAYSPGSPRLHAAARPLLAAFDRQRLSLIRYEVSPPARLLDVGAGRGRFVAAARRAGYDATGIEPSRRGTEAAAQVGAPVLRTGVEEADIEPGSVQVVSLWHVLEHLEDPAGVLDRIRSWLAPGGTLLVGVPNLDSLQARLGGEYWYHLDVPRHRTHFTARGLEALLGSCGFTVRRTHHVLAEHNPFGMWQSLLSRVTHHPSYVYNALKRNAPLASPDLALSVAALPLVPLAALLELGAGLARRGGTIAVVAHRPG
jgi:2-polyprenyl-3-methyl-5-hydroxy-6-metoxy-1,4-benzoquinol methylase